MKLVSKMSNYRIVLQHSIPAEPITGRNATPGVWVKFENGVAEVRDEKTIQMLLNHPLYNADFVASENEKDPYLDVRQQSEPDHHITNLEYGHVASSINAQPNSKISKEMKKIVMDMAKGMAAEMAPELAKKMLKEVLSQNPELVKGALSEASGMQESTKPEPEEVKEPGFEEIKESVENPKPRRGRPKANN